MDKLKKLLLLIFLTITVFNIYPQGKKKFKLHTIAFYNLENLFDTINNPNKNDEASPIMRIKTNRSESYKKKSHNMARVLSEIGSNVSKNTPAIIGLAEIENIEVLEHLVNDSLLINKNYGIIHYESPDPRGIDVGLLYQKRLFQPTSKSKHTLMLYSEQTGKRIYTRDQLLVSGKLDGETIHFIVNHWPSRRGGETKSRSKRIAAAKLNKQIIDSLQSHNPYSKIVIMGDLNDNPTDSSVKEVLKAKRKIKNMTFKDIYNPMINLFKKGLGSNAYRDRWALFDQIMLTHPFVEKDYKSYQFYTAGIFNKNYLINKKGQYKGYPFRSFTKGRFTNGFSDHFPVYIYLIKEVK